LHSAQNLEVMFAYHLANLVLISYLDCLKEQAMAFWQAMTPDGYKGQVERIKTPLRKMISSDWISLEEPLDADVRQVIETVRECAGRPRNSNPDWTIDD